MKNTTNTPKDKPWLPTVTESKLDNGVGALFVDMPDCPVFSSSILFRAGDYLCPDDKPDLAHFLEHLVFMANENYPSQEEFTRVIQAGGGYIHAYTGPVVLKYYFNAPDFDWSRMLDLAMLGVSRPLFLPQEFANEKDTVRNEHLQCLDDPVYKILRTVGREVGFPSVHPDDRLACLDSITVEDVKDYHRQTHTLDNARFVFAGHLPPSRQQLIIKKLDSFDLHPGDRPPLPNKKLKSAGLVYDHKADAEMVAYDLSFVVNEYPPDTPGWAARSLINRLFLAGDHSWVFGRARKRGLVYEVSGYIDFFGDSMRYITSGQVNPENLESLLDLIIEAIDRLLSGDLSDEDFEYQKKSATGSLQMLYTEPQRLVESLEPEYIRDSIGPVDLGFRIEFVDKRQLISTAHKMFGSFDWTLGLLGNVPNETRKRIEDKLNRRKK